MKLNKQPVLALFPFIIIGLWALLAAGCAGPEPTAPAEPEAPPPTSAVTDAVTDEPAPTAELPPPELPPPAISDEVPATETDLDPAAGDEVEGASIMEGEIASVNLPETSRAAFRQDNELYLQTGTADPILVDTCTGDFCLFQYLRWSPNGQHLLYYVSGFDEASEQRVSHLYLTDQAGERQLVAEDVALLRPGDWSPDGSQIVYLRSTDRFVDAESEEFPGMGFHVHEVWTTAVAADGQVGDSILVGEINMMDGGCGGGGRSVSEELYENEGGTAYGYQMAVTTWAADGILFYSLNCANVGIGRYDLNNGSQLDPLPGDVRNLVLNQARDRWFALEGYAWAEEPARLVTGLPADITYEPLPTTGSPELLFYTDGRLYYTTQTMVDQVELEMGFGYRLYQSELWRLQADGSDETRLWSGDDTAYAQVQVGPDGAVWFVLIPTDAPFYEAATPEEAEDLRPQLQIVRLQESDAALAVWRLDAGLLALTERQ